MVRSLLQSSEPALASSSTVSSVPKCSSDVSITGTRPSSLVSARRLLARQTRQAKAADKKLLVKQTLKDEEFERYNLI